jgi:hypothetical protein
MRAETSATWWQRLLFALGALLLVLALLIALAVGRDYWRDPTLQWSKGGEVQIAGFLLIVGGIMVAAVYLLFIVPLVLLWSFKTTRSRWYVMLGVWLLWPVLFRALFIWKPLMVLLTEVRRSPGVLLWPEVFAVCFFGLCFFLIDGKQGRRARLTT